MNKPTFNQIAQNLLRKKALQKGINLIDPKTVYFSYDTILEKDIK